MMELWNIGKMEEWKNGKVCFNFTFA